MQKIYTLLRNNKQSGPYTLDEILQMKLKAFDLVWVEGKSAGWSYPTEIDSLKNFVTETPKPSEKRQESIQLPIAGAETKTNVASEKKSNTATPPVVKHIYISLPAGSSVAAAAKTSLPLPEIKEDESPEAKLERKAQELRNKIQAFSEKKNQPTADNDLDTRYSRSLDDIKEEYSSWLTNQRKKKNGFSKKKLLMAGSAGLLFMIGFFLIPRFFSSGENTPHILSAEEIAASKPDFIQLKSEVSSDIPEKKPAGSFPKKKTNTKIKSFKTGTPVNKGNNKKIEENDRIDIYIDSLKNIESKTAQPDEDIVHERSSNQEGSRQRTKRDETTATKKNSTKKEADTAPFTELVKLSESTGNGNPHLSLYNNSNRHINFVAIDVYYYRANQKLLRKKTVYFNDISPRSAAKLFVPKEKNAASVRYQMGLISTDSGIYYAKQ